MKIAGGTCTMPKVTGYCNGAIPKWYYNINAEKCEKFVWSMFQG